MERRKEFVLRTAFFPLTQVKGSQRRGLEPNRVRDHGNRGKRVVHGLHHLDLEASRPQEAVYDHGKRNSQVVNGIK